MIDRSDLKSLSVDELALSVTGLKEEAAILRQMIWAFEDELRDRLAANEASVLMGEEYRVKSSLKREVTWDQAALKAAEVAAVREFRLDAFRKAFPYKYDCSVRGLNALLKLGGETAKAIEAARGEVKQKLDIKVEPIK